MRFHNRIIVRDLLYLALLSFLILPNKHPEADEKSYILNKTSEENNTNRFWFNDYANSDHFNLFNLFNVFRGTESKLLDDNGNLIPLDSSELRAGGGENINNNGETSTSNREEPFISLIRSRQSINLTRKVKQVEQQQQSRSINLNQFKQHLISSLSGSDKSKPSGGSSRSEEQKSLADNNNSPVVLIPGYGGTRLEAKLHKPSGVRYFCDLESDWSDIWINVKLLLPYMIDCLIDNLRLEYNSTTHTTQNTAGVEIRVKNPSSISSVEYLHQLPLSGFAYFAPIIDKLTATLNYKRETNIRGAPYDFRKAPNELEEHFSNLKSLGELLYESNNRKPVSFICHSMGCNQMLYFLQRQSEAWKDKYVRRLISLAAPWAGSFSALRAAAMGDDLGMPYLFSESKLIKVQRSLPSTIFLFPHRQMFSQVPLIRSNVGKQLARSMARVSGGGGGNSVNGSLKSINETSSNDADDVNSGGGDEMKLYTVDNFESFFRDINHPDGYKMWLDTKDLLGSLEAPGVEVWCIVGRAQKTLGRMEFLGSFPNSQSIEIYDDGDGTVNLDSAKYCTNWVGKQKQSVNYKEFQVSHMGILKDEQVLNYIREILGNDENEIL